MLIFILGVPLLPGYDPMDKTYRRGLVAIGDRTFDGTYYLLGSDPLGRDMLSRLALAGQVSAPSELVPFS